MDTNHNAISDRIAEEYLRRGNQAYEAREYLQAVQFFSEALRHVPSLHTAYYNRSAALVALKRYEEALNDAHLVTTLAPSWAAAFSRKGYVLWCMGEIGRALEAYEMANSMEPHDDEVKRNIATLQSLLREKEAALFRESEQMEEEARGKQVADPRDVSLSEDFECVLCLKVFYDPVTTPCGHTFCRSCLFRAMDHGTQCPLCRGIVHLATNHPTTVSLSNIIKRLFPEEYRQREAEAQKEIIQDETCMPLFPLNAVVYPNMRCPMHIFEPRYRLMLRRCMAGAKTFGLINIRRDRSGSSWVPYDVGCTLQINKISILPDGRSYIDTQGKRRFKVLEKWEVDGYLVGKIQYIDDEPCVRPDEMAILHLHVQEARRLVHNLMASGICETNEQVKRLIAQAGHDIPTDDLQFSYWLLTVLPLNTDIKQELLEMTSTPQRLTRILDILRIYLGLSRSGSPSALATTHQPPHPWPPLVTRVGSGITTGDAPAPAPAPAPVLDNSRQGRATTTNTDGLPLAGVGNATGAYGGPPASPAVQHPENCILS